MNVFIMFINFYISCGEKQKYCEYCDFMVRS